MAVAYSTGQCLHDMTFDGLQVVVRGIFLLRDSGYRLAKQTRNTEVTGWVPYRKVIALYRDDSSGVVPVRDWPCHFVPSEGQRPCHALQWTS
jgi:hypothetical protein